MKKVTAPLLSAILAASFLVLSAPAHAIVCTTTTLDQAYDRWNANPFATGFRAPVTLRRNGDICSQPGPSASVSNWVGIEDLDGSSPNLAQIGWLRYLGSPYFSGFCRFWEIVNPDDGPNIYHCGEDTGGTVHYFKVESVHDSGTNSDHFAMYDCGQSDWSNCTRQDLGPNTNRFSTSYGEVAAESSTQCQNDEMGSSSNTVLYTPITGQGTQGGSYSQKNLFFNTQNHVCSHYIFPTHGDQTFESYDDRN